MAALNTNLNWKELARVVEKIAPLLTGLFVERVIVPERGRFPAGFLKGEWLIRFTGKRSEGGLLISVRPRHPYITWLEGRGPKASQRATHSVFDLSLSKYLKGQRVSGFETFPRERICALWFLGKEGGSNRLGLILSLIPAVPEALLVEDDRAAPGFKILARSRMVKDGTARFIVPDGARAPEALELRSEWIENVTGWSKIVEQALDQEAFEERVRIFRKQTKHLLDEASDRIRQSETAIEQGRSEPEWRKLGDLLKGSLGNPPPLKDGKIRDLLDYETGETVSVVCDPKLSPQAQAEKFYQNAKRKVRRIEEAQSRVERYSEARRRFEAALGAEWNSRDWPALEALEKKLGVLPTPAKSGPGAKKGAGAWMGKAVRSKDGLPILVGRDKTENLELTFKVARGNDLWFHVRGKPGAHALIQMQPGKSASLDALLDAAHLVLYYSGGEKWGKTEVDYTHKKYVKRIKDSTEASYTHNKTLIIEIDPIRMKRLLES